MKLHITFTYVQSTICIKLLDRNFTNRSTKKKRSPKLFALHFIASQTDTHHTHRRFLNLLSERDPDKKHMA